MATKQKPARDEKGRFRPGNSGNPGGKRAMPSHVKLKLLDAVPDAVAALVELTKSKDHAVRLRAIQTLLERVYGKAQVGVVDEAPKDVAKQLAALEARAAELALSGDSRMLELLLRAHAPEKYGPPKDSDGTDDDDAVTSVNFVRQGEARPEKKWNPED